jgi:hypothetical protein
MKIYPDDNVRHGCAIGFEIDNIYVSLGTVARILGDINGVTEVKKRKLFSRWEEIHIWFKYLNHECFVIEPFGDSSRYWIGSRNPEEKFDISRIEEAFKRYQPSPMVKIIGDLVRLNWKSLFSRNKKDT